MSKKNIGLLSVIAILLVGAIFAFSREDSEQIPADVQNRETEIQLTDSTSDISDSDNTDAAETADWQTYEDSKAGFSFRYPANIAIKGVNEMAKEDYNRRTLSILVEPFVEIEEGPLGYDKETLGEVKTALEKNEYGPSVSHPLEESKKVVNLGKINAQTFAVFAVLDNSAVFEKHMLFFNNDYFVDIVLRAPISEMVKTNPQYFNEEEMGWKFEEDDNIISRFYQNLENGKCSEVAQDWKDTFDEIVGTVKIR
jgi:hypothetical protein